MTGATRLGAQVPLPEERPTARPKATAIVYDVAACRQIKPRTRDKISTLLRERAPIAQRQAQPACVVAASLRTALQARDMDQTTLTEGTARRIFAGRLAALILASARIRLAAARQTFY